MNSHFKYDRIYNFSTSFYFTFSTQCIYECAFSGFKDKRYKNNITGKWPNYIYIILCRTSDKRVKKELQRNA